MHRRPDSAISELNFSPSEHIQSLVVNAARSSLAHFVPQLTDRSKFYKTKETSVTQENMNLQSLVVVTLRLITLNFLLLAVIYLTPQLYLFADTIDQDDFLAFDSFTVVPLAIVAGILVGAVLIWIFSQNIARLVVRGLPQEISIGSVTLVDWYSFWSNILPMVIGTLLFLKGRNWAQKVAESHAKKENVNQTTQTTQ